MNNHIRPRSYNTDGSVYACVMDRSPHWFTTVTSISPMMQSSWKQRQSGLPHQ